MPVVDASVVVDWVAPDSDPAGAARRFLAALASEARPVLAPRLLFEEVGNALLTGVRRGRWRGSEADDAFRRLLNAPLRVADESTDVGRAWELSRRHDEHPLYDLVYVAVAQRLGEDLVTADERLVARLQLPFVRSLASIYGT